jgi:hypothetical protein
MILRLVRCLAACLAAAALLTGATSAAAQASPGASAPPRAVDLDGAGWQYAPDHRTWSAVDLPHVFDAKPTAQDFSGQTGWYRISLQ